MAADVDVKMSDRQEEMLDMELEKFLENAINPLSIPNETNSYPMWN